MRFPFVLVFAVCCLAALASLCPAAGLAAGAAKQGGGVIAARRATVPVVVDGRLDEAEWGLAVWSGQLVDIVDGTPGWLGSRCVLLWDDEALYASFRLEELDLRATLTEHDAPIYQDNDVELFIAGPDAYYELELNALGTVYDVLWLWEDVYGPGAVNAPWPDLDRAVNTMRIDGVAGHIHPRGWRTGFIAWNLPGLRTAVQTSGTLNESSDEDQGWTVEIAIPWVGLERLVLGMAR